MGVSRTDLSAGVDLLGQPLMPLVSMVQFLYMTGPFPTIAEVIDELPEPIETDRASYASPRELLAGFMEILAGFEQVKDGSMELPKIVDELDNPVDPFTAGIALVRQRMLKEELEKINSLLCGPCGCTLCCEGPKHAMEHEFFEIPLEEKELEVFACQRIDSEQSRSKDPMDENEFVWQGQPFYRVSEPTLFHWQKGWSLILPKKSSCPNLQDNGQCRVYNDRPQVCRRPQIFPYILEKLENDGPTLRIRNSLLAVMDCPYVQELQEEIGEYAAASELHLHFTRNKQ